MFPQNLSFVLPRSSGVRRFVGWDIEINCSRSIRAPQSLNQVLDVSELEKISVQFFFHLVPQLMRHHSCISANNRISIQRFLHEITYRWVVTVRENFPLAIQFFASEIQIFVVSPQRCWILSDHDVSDPGKSGNKCQISPSVQLVLVIRGHKIRVYIGSTSTGAFPHFLPQQRQPLGCLSQSQAQFIFLRNQKREMFCGNLFLKLLVYGFLLVTHRGFHILGARFHVYFLPILRMKNTLKLNKKLGLVRK